MKKGSKNSIENRGKAAMLRRLDGKEVIPVKYVGKRQGHGTYIAAAYKDSGQMAVDSNGKPIPYGKV